MSLVNVNQLPFNPPPVDPELKDVLDKLKTDILLSLFCHQIATIQTYNPVNQTAQATINYKKTYVERDPISQLYASKLVDYPVLMDCPVICLGGGSASLTFPIKKGDECIVLFNDRDIDNWFESGGGAGVNTTRLHSFSDGIILVGVRSLNNVLTNYDMIRAVLQNGTAMVGVGPTLIKIANNSFTLNTLLQSLITQIENLVTATAAITVTAVTAGGGVSGPPANAAAIVAIGAQLTTIATEISGLLE